MSKITAIILAAGAGKRIKPIVTSKPLISFCNRPLISWIIDDLKKIKINNFIIVANPHDNFSGYQTVIQSEPNGMAAAVLLALKIVSRGPLIIVNGDDLIDPKIIAKFYQQINRTPEKIVLTAIKSNLPGGYFAGLKIIEKPTQKPSPWLKLVLDYFPHPKPLVKVLNSVSSQQDDQYEQALNKLSDQIVLVKAAGYFQSLKYPWDILDMMKIFLNQRHQAKIDKTAKLMPGVNVINSYIGPNVVLGHHALVRDSIIEAGSVVGYHTEICRSYVGPNNNFHTNYVGDSIIEAGSNLGSGARLANMRFDKKEILPGRKKLGAVMAKGSQLGINASVMPGVLLGSNSICGSGLVLKQNLEANEFKNS